MLDPWIIEEILKREEAKRDQERPRAELPIQGPPHYHEQTPAVQPPTESERGVAIIDI